MENLLIILKAASFRWHIQNPQRLSVAAIALFLGALLGNIILDLNARTSTSFSSAMGASMNAYGASFQFANPVNGLSLDALWDHPELEGLHFFPYSETYFQHEGKRYPLAVRFCPFENCLKSVLVPEFWLKEFTEVPVVKIGKKTFPVRAGPPGISVAQLDIAAFPITELELTGIFSLEDFTEREIEVLLGLFPGSQVIPIGEQKTDSDSITSAFRQNLFALAMVALLVAGYLVYASLDISFENRSALFSSLLSLGFTRRQLGMALFVESLLLGGFVGFLAWFFGFFLARLGWQFFSLFLPDVFGVIPTQYSSFLPGSVILPLTLATSCISAYLAYKRRDFGGGRKRESLLKAPSHREISMLAGFGLVVTTVALFQTRNPYYGYGSVAILFLLLGNLSRYSLGLIPRIFPDTIHWKLAYRSLEGYSQRFLAPVSALAVAIALCISMTILVSSFRNTLILWLESHVRADIYLSFHSHTSLDDRNQVVLRAEERFPGQILTLYMGSALVRNENLEARAEVMGQSFSKIRSINPPDVTTGSLDEILTSETAEMRWDIDLGSTVSFPEYGLERPVRGVFRNYTGRRGTFLIDTDNPANQPLLGAMDLAGLAIYSDDTGELERFQMDYFDLGVFQASKELRSSAIALFDQTFAITYILQGITFFLASAAIAFSLISLLSARRRQFAILATFLPSSRLQMISVVILEAFGVLLASLIIALPASFYLTWILIDGINRFSFGWTLSWDVPYAYVVGIVIGSFGSGLVTSAYIGSRLPVKNLWKDLKSRE